MFATTFQRKLTPEKVAEYLQRREYCDAVLEIYHPKVAQKSYGQEKRFFCPPPMVYMRGNGWRMRQSAILASTTNGLFQISNDVNDELDEPIGFIGIVGSKEQEGKELEWQCDSEGRCAIKALHISETDNNRRKYFTLFVQLHYIVNTNFGNGKRPLGSFESKRIKVISKPSKKKNINNTNSKHADLKNQGINIASGTEVALFSRVRSQTTNTRYLFVKDAKFVAHSKFWGSFTIYLIDTNGHEIDPDSNDFNVLDGYINYGSIVKLVDSVNGLALPMMKICKVDKQDLVDERDSANEQVSQLHKCAFQFLNNGSRFLGFNNDQITQLDALITEKDGRITFKDGAQWTIISTDTTHYRFYEALGPVRTEISPVPIVNSLDMHANDTNAYIELQGQNFHVNLQVWIGSTQVPTTYINSELIQFVMPQFNVLNKEDGVVINSNEQQRRSPIFSSLHRNNVNYIHSTTNDDIVLEFPLILAREDGVIYGTELSIAYLRTRHTDEFIPISRP